MNSSSSRAFPITLNWTWARLEALGAGDVYDFLALRSEVFVVEQSCVFLDADGVDRQAWHLLGRNLAGELLAYLRLVDAKVKYPELSIGRVITSPRARAMGLGKRLMQEGLKRTLQMHPNADIRISAQARLQKFYASLGFRTQSEPYMEDGIAHVEMLLSYKSNFLAQDLPCEK